MKKMFPFVCVLLTLSCHHSQIIVHESPNQHSMVFDGKVFTALYQQRAAEYKALCLQAFNSAANSLNQYQSKTSFPKVIITDIDETILDNSPFAVHQNLLKKEYDSNAWYEWSSKVIADTVPGAPAFLKYAASKGIEIFYVTNREERERNCTIANLKKYNLPNADSSHLLLKSTTSSKEARRMLIANNHEIMMFLGDNLGDFSKIFDKKNPNEREANVNASLADWGSKFIVLPNPNYGDWEGSLLNYNYKLTAAQKDSIYKSVLKSY